MFIIIGLGNPGDKFKNTPHNIGFQVIDYFAEKNNFSGFKLDKKSNSLISENENILLAKPQTFMNESGKAVKKLITNRQEPIVVVAHDDIDLPLGKIKIVKDRGSAGHKGVESIIQAIGNTDLIRLRIGIETQDVKAEKVVLKNFTQEQQEVAGEAIKKAVLALENFIAEGLEKTMNKFN